MFLTSYIPFQIKNRTRQRKHCKSLIESLNIFESCNKKECPFVGGNQGVGGDGDERMIRRRLGRGGEEQ